MIFSETNCHPSVREDDFKRFLRYPPRRPFAGPLAENATWAREWFARHGQPWWCAREIALEVVPETGLLLEGQPFGSPTLAARFSEATSAVVIAASAGPEADAESAARWAADEPDRYFFLECYSAAVVEALLAEARRRVAAWTVERTVLPHYCPGYPGWPITDAPALLALVRGNAALPGLLDTLSSGMLRPKKSQLALMGLKPVAALASS